MGMFSFGTSTLAHMAQMNPMAPFPGKKRGSGPFSGDYQPPQLQMPWGSTDVKLDNKRRSPDNLLDPYSGEADYSSENAQYAPGFQRFGDRDKNSRYKNAYARAYGSAKLSLFG